MLKLYPWNKFSRSLIEKCLTPYCIGSFDKEREKRRNMRVEAGEEIIKDLGATLKIFLLIDESDGIIADAKFQAFGPIALIGIAETVCQLVLRKNYEQAKRIQADLIDRHLSGIPEEIYFFVHVVLSAVQQAAQKCSDIALLQENIKSPLPSSSAQDEPSAEFETLSKEQKIQRIQQVIDEDIRPYIELDAGGIEIVDLNGNELKIRYQGACTTCPSSIGTTLSAIQNILQAKISSDMAVYPINS